MEVSKILFINLDRIGDTVRSTFIFRALKSKYPDAYIATLTVSPSDEILRNDPFIDDVFVLPHSEIRGIMDIGKTILHMAMPAFTILEKLKAHNFDLIINPFSEFGAIAVRYLKPKYFLGRGLDKNLNFVIYGKNASQFAYVMSNVGGRRGKEQRNFAEFYASILEDLGIALDHSQLYPKIYVAECDELFATEFLNEHYFDKNALTVGFQIGAFTKDKMWPLEKYASLVNKLKSKSGVNIVLTGSPYEAKTVISKMCKLLDEQPIVSAGKTNINQAVAIINKCNLFVSNDTGPMHCAAALDVDIVALFGYNATIPNESRPWGDNHIVIGSQNIDDIEVDIVFNACLRQLNKLNV